MQLFHLVRHLIHLPLHFNRWGWPTCVILVLVLWRLNRETISTYRHINRNILSNIAYHVGHGKVLCSRTVFPSTSTIMFWKDESPNSEELEWVTPRSKECLESPRKTVGISKTHVNNFEKIFLLEIISYFAINVWLRGDFWDSLHNPNLYKSLSICYHIRPISINTYNCNRYKYLLQYIIV